MSEKPLANSSNFSKLLFILFIILVSLLFFMVLGIFVAIPVFGIHLTNLMSQFDIQQNANIPLVKFFQVIQSVGMFVIPPFIITFLFSKNIGEYLQLNKQPIWFSILLVSLIMIFAIPFINFLADWNSKLVLPDFLSGIEQFMKETEHQAELITQAFLKTNSFGGYLINVLIIALIPALGEELLFRGIFQKLFTDWTKNFHLGIWIAAFLFSAMHMQFYGFIPRLLLGGFFGYLLVLSKNLWLPITAHFINNAFAVTAYYISDKTGITNSAENLGTGKHAYNSVFVSLLLVGMLVIMLVRYEKEK